MKEYSKSKKIISVLLIMILLSACAMPYLMKTQENRMTTISAATALKALEGLTLNPSQDTGTKDNPFIVLEIVPYRGVGEFGYLVGGQEPVELSKEFCKEYSGVVAGSHPYMDFLTKETLESGDRLEGGEWSYKTVWKEHQTGYYQKVTDHTGRYNMKVDQVNYMVKFPSFTGDYDKTTEYTSNYEKSWEADNKQVIFKYSPETFGVPKYNVNLLTKPSWVTEKSYYTLKDGIYEYDSKGNSSDVTVTFAMSDNGSYIVDTDESIQLPSVNESKELLYKAKDSYFYNKGKGEFDRTVTKASFEKSKFGTGNYKWVDAEESNPFPADYNADKVWFFDYKLDISYYQHAYLLKNKELFKTKVLGLKTEEEINNYHIRVVTVTPEELNQNVKDFTSGTNMPDEIDLIANADIYYINGKDHYSSVDMWQKYGKDKTGMNNPRRDFGTNDLSWDSVVKLFMKIGINEKTPLIFDFTVYDLSTVAASTKKGNLKARQAESLPYYDIGTGSINNIYKLCLMLRQRDPLEFYNLFLNTNGGTEVPLVTKVNYNVNGVNIGTGSYSLQKSGNSTSAATYWNDYTFVPPEPGDKYTWNIEYWKALGIIVDGGDNTAVIRNTYSFNGDNSMTSDCAKDIQNLAYNERFTKDVFVYFFGKELEPKPLPKLTTNQVLIYLLSHKIEETNKKLSVTILELEPCNDFSLTVQEVRKMIPTYKGIIKIEHQTTPEFIGKIEDLNNKYDLVYIGENTGKMNTDSYGKTIYNDPLLDGLIYLHVGDRILGFDNFAGILKKPNGSIDKALNYIKFSEGSQSAWKKNQQNIFKGYNLNSSDNKNGDFIYIKDVADFYRFSGNDITERKRKNLQEYLEAGFPILLENELYQCNKSKIDDSSQLFQFLTENKGETMMINRDDFKGSVTQFLEAQKNMTELLARERISIDLKTAPVEFDVDDLSTLISTRTLPFDFIINPPSDVAADADFNWNIYVDANADGRFVAKEIIASGVNKKEENIVVTKTLSEKYVGVIPWKVEVYAKDSPYIRSEQTGFAAFKTMNSSLEQSKTQINVLQITSNNSNNNLEQLMNPPSGKTSLFSKFTKNLDDFNVKIKTINVSQFEDKYKNGKAYNVNKPEATDQLYYIEDGVKKSYDMLLFGFGDSYSDISNANGALNNVQAFIDSGRSVLFTHDTTSFINMPASQFETFKNNQGINIANWGYGFNQYLRNVVGLDRFGVFKKPGDTTPYDTAVMPSQSRVKDIYTRNADGSMRSTYPETQGMTFPMLVSFGNPKPWNSIYNENKNYPPFNTANSSIYNGNIMNRYVTNRVSKVNEGQITSYPYDIPDDFTIATTHGQYYQTNMEDSEIVVWFCLSDSNTEGAGPYTTSPHDVRNSYYIYSKGNVMYSGVGHSAIDTITNGSNPDMTNANEVKLFINTMIASYSAGITAPEVRISNEEAVKDTGNTYVIYEDSEDNIGKTGQTKRIRFKVEDTNLISDDLIARIYYYNYTSNKFELVEPLVMNMSGNLCSRYEETGKEKGIWVKNSKEYYFEFPLDKFNAKGTDKIYISVTNEENIKGDTNLVLQQRGLFDLD